MLDVILSGREIAPDEHAVQGAAIAAREADQIVPKSLQAIPRAERMLSRLFEMASRNQLGEADVTSLALGDQNDLAPFRHLERCADQGLQSVLAADFIEFVSAYERHRIADGAPCKPEACGDEGDL